MCPVVYGKLDKVVGGPHLVGAFFIYGGQFPGRPGRQIKISDVRIRGCVGGRDDGAADAALGDGAQGVVAGGLKQNVRGVSGLLKERGAW